MSKKKRFEHRPIRPTLGASLEAVRQGKEVAPVVVDRADTYRTEPTPVATPKHASSTNEGAYVMKEVRRIGLTVGGLLLVLLLMTYLESRNSFLTQITQRFIR